LLLGLEAVSTIADVGQTSTHLPHNVHFSASIYAKLLCIVMASNSHTLKHFKQPIHDTLHAFLLIAPFSLLTQFTNIRRESDPFLRNSIINFGQALTQAPHEVHFSSSTSGNKVLGLIKIASNLQDTTQSPNPRQPYEQPVSPPYKLCAIKQEFTPSYWLILGRKSHVPPHRTTATNGEISVALSPKMAATFSIVAFPPTGHDRFVKFPAFTQAVAKPLHPGKPHAPQFAAGSAASTSLILKSSTTSNFLEIKKRITAEIAPIITSVNNEISIRFIGVIFQ